MVLSVNSSNRDRAVHWGCEVVVVPDDPATLAGLDETVQMLAEAGVRLRIDPVLEPIGFGFAASLGRYLAVRQKWPDAPMLMGIEPEVVVRPKIESNIYVNAALFGVVIAMFAGALFGRDPDATPAA